MSNLEIHGDGSSISIEETNKLRISLGLSPLSEEKVEEKADFVHIPAKNIGDVRKTERSLKKLKDHNDDREMRRKLNEIPSLIDGPMPILNIDILEKKAEFTRKRKEQEYVSDEDEVEEGEVYNEKDLSGLTIEHNPSRFGNTLMPTILTIKDSYILDNREDTLENVNIADYEKFEENVRNKKAGVHYNPDNYDDDEDFNNSKPILQKYDEGNKKSFTIDATGKYDLTQDIRMQKIQSAMLGTKINLPEFEPKVSNDYYTSEEMMLKLKSKKKRKAAVTRTYSNKTTIKSAVKNEDRKVKKEEGELIEEENKDAKRTKLNANIDQNDSDDDDDLFRQNLVYSEIKQATSVNNRVKNDIETTRRILSKGRSNKIDVDNSIEEVERPTGSFFISNSSSNNDIIYSKLKAQHDHISTNQPSVKEEPVIIQPVLPPKMETVENDEKDLLITETSGWQPEDNISSVRVEAKKTFKSVSSVPQAKKDIKLKDGILGDEVQLNRGVVSAVLLAMSKGYLDQPKEEIKLSNPKSKILNAQKFYEEKIRYDDIDSKGPRRERYTGPVSTFQDKKDYNPEINIEHYDEFGRVQDQKEAFRSLSHGFHGKAPGKIKREKRINSYTKEMKHESTVDDIAMKSVNKQYNKMKDEKKFCVALSGKNAIIPSSLKKSNKKGKTSPK